MQGNPCYARLFADLTRTPQGAFSCPFGTIHLVSPNPIIASGGKAERRQWREERGGSPVSKGAPGRPHGPTQRDFCELHCGPRAPRGFSTSWQPPLLGRLLFVGAWGGGGGGGVLRPKAAKQAGGRATPGCRRVGAAHPPPPPRGGNCNTIPWGKEIANRIQAAGYMTMQRDGIKRPTRCRRRWRTWC